MCRTPSTATSACSPLPLHDALHLMTGRRSEPVRGVAADRGRRRRDARGRRGYAIGARFLALRSSPKPVARSAGLAEERYPIQGTQFSLVRAREALEEVHTSGPLYEVISLPLAPFHALQGVDTGAAAVRDFNQTARRFSHHRRRAPCGAARPDAAPALRRRRSPHGETERGRLRAGGGERRSACRSRWTGSRRSSARRSITVARPRGVGGARAGGIQRDGPGQRAGWSAPGRPRRSSARRARLARHPRAEGSHTARPRRSPFRRPRMGGHVRTLGASAVELRALATEPHGLAGALEGFSVSASIDRLSGGGRADRDLLRAPAHLSVLAARLLRRA